jgi:hypothetical protein
MRETPIGLDGPPGHTGKVPPESCAAPATFLGFLAPTATSARRSTQPGIPTPIRSASRVSHPHDGFLPPSLPATRTGATHGVHPPELFPPAEPYTLRRQCPPAVPGIAYSCSENQKFTMPRSSRALLPARIRTPAGRSRPEADALMGFSSPLQSVPIPPGGRLPGPFPHALCPTDLREAGSSVLQGVDERSGRTPLAGRPTLLRFSTRYLSSVSPDDSDAPAGEPAERSIDLAGGSLPRTANSPFTALPKRSLQRAGPFGAVPGISPSPTLPPPH